MNGNKTKYILEIAYNCPFILLLLVTGLFAIPFLNKIESRDTDKAITIMNILQKEEKVEEEEQNEHDILSKALKDKWNNDSEIAADHENDSETTLADQENEGTRKEGSTEIENKTKQNSGNSKSAIAVKQRHEETRATKFVEYTPIETNSRYYSDAGKVALTTTYDYVLENDSYFNDAVFLGDSRTLGISDYAGLEGADFFCDNGMTIYKLLEDTGVTWQRTGEKMDMKKVLQENHYGKIYIMLGMNELGYGDTTMYLKQYLKVIRKLREWQPEAVIYVMANLHVSREKNDMESEFNNININDKNVASARLADGRNVFYLDCNPIFTDEEGYLQAELSFDGVHLYAQHYDKWREFLMEHGVERNDAFE